MTLKLYYDKIQEIGIDEAGRGPLFGRVYSAAVILNKDFDITMVKDSKKFTSNKKLLEAYDYIINHSQAYSISYVDENEIDKINIKEATIKAMHKSIKCLHIDLEGYTILVDGNCFKPYMKLINYQYQEIPYILIPQGDNKYASIAAASILAKVERDKYIEALCCKFPKLIENYNLLNNKGYGTKLHIEGIEKYGITKFHRKTFKQCKNKLIIKLTQKNTNNNNINENTNI